jgi:hypothetical protein
MRGQKERQVESASNSVYSEKEDFRNNQSELFEPGTYLQNDARPGWFALLYRPGVDAVAKQVTYPIKSLVPIVQTINPTYDTWISQAIFERPSRRAVYLRDIGLLYADLDTYNLSYLRNLTTEVQVCLLLNYCAVVGIPQPSIVMYSGRGLQVKWLLDTAIPRASILRWTVVESALIETLDGFAADTKARDVSRVLRLEHTVNLKSGEMARVIHVRGPVDNPARYSLDDFDGLVMRSEENRPTPALVGGRKPFRTIAGKSVQELDWARLEDIRQLWVLRGGCVEGYRETTLFWSLNWLMRAAPVPLDQCYHEAQALAAEIYPGVWYKDSDVSTVYRKAREYRMGKTVTFQGREYPALYTPRNDTLINIFRITSDEQRHMTTIIDQAEKDRRRSEKRWAAGAKPQAESWARRKPWKEFGVSRPTWYRMGKPLPGGWLGDMASGGTNRD